MPSTPPIIEMEPSFSAEERLVETPITQAFDRSIFCTLLALLIYGPLVFGAAEPWSVAILQCGATLLGLLWCARQVAARAAIFHGNVLFFPVAQFGIVVLSQLLLGTTAYRNASVVEIANFVSY